jgi:hypothetical protein
MLGWRVFPGKNTLAYWAHLVMKKERNIPLTPGTTFTTLYFLFNLPMVPVSYSVTLY